MTERVRKRDSKIPIAGQKRNNSPLSNTTQLSPDNVDSTGKPEIRNAKFLAGRDRHRERQRQTEKDRETDTGK